LGKGKSIKEESSFTPSSRPSSYGRRGDNPVGLQLTQLKVPEFVMAVKIIESCVNCFACEPVCPSNAIYEAKPHFLVDPKKCTECEGDFPDFQCASICPIEGAILNSLGEAINPPGSLTGIPPEKMAEAMAELQSH
jgi:ferredoxin